jgi:hypothetical protein
MVLREKKGLQRSICHGWREDAAELRMETEGGKGDDDKGVDGV